jgi:hypothetical protein
MEHDSSSSAGDPLDRLAAEFLDWRCAGGPISPPDALTNYPYSADRILEFFPAIEIMWNGSAEVPATRPIRWRPGLAPPARVAWKNWASTASSPRSATAG